MPKNREALIRYRVINRLIVDRKYVSLKEMATACEDALDKAPLSVRTLRQDLFDMRNNRQLGYFAPIEYDHSERAYHYTDPNYSIDRLPLTGDEVDALAFAGKMLEQYRDTEPFNHARGAVDKILEHMKIRKALEKSSYRDFVDFERPLASGGSEFIEPLINAMKRKKVIRMTYQSFEKDHPSTFPLHPYLLKEYRNRWYIFGFNEGYQQSRTYALDRIQKLEPDPMASFIEPSASPQDYFRNIVGITRVPDSMKRKVILRFSRHQANYILTQPLHDSQQVLEIAGNFVIISLDIEDSPDLNRLLLGWGEEVEVIEPVSLKEEIRRIHGQSAILHNRRPVVYFDMDGVLVDFKSRAENLSEEEKQRYPDHPDDIPGIFKDLKLIPEGIEAFHRICKKYDCYILSTAPWDNPSAWSDKLEWVKKNLGDAAYKRLILSHHKDLNCGSYLIDDRSRHGAAEFRGKWIHLGSEEFPGWGEVIKYLGI